MKASTFITKTLKGYGVSHVFYVEAILRRALIEMEGEGIERILAHSEKAAAYMADGYARAGRKPGICMSQSVGAENLLAGIKEPFLGHSAVIAITGRKPALSQYRNAYQEALHGPMYGPLTKLNAEVEEPQQLAFLLPQAFREATSGTPGPVHLDLMGHQGQNTETGDISGEVVVEEPFTKTPSLRIEPAPENIVEAIRVIEAAERPVIVVGRGAVISGAYSELVQFSEALSIPVAASPSGKGIIADNHPNYVGIVGRYSCWCANEIVSESDLVIFIGCNTGDMVTDAWSVPEPGKPVIQIDIDPSELGRNYTNRVSILADAKVALKRLVERIPTKVERPKWIQQAQSLRKQWLDEIEEAGQSGEKPIKVERLCRELSEVLPEDAVLLADTGYSSIWTSTMVLFKHPEQRYYRCAGSLGWAFPASLGAKCACKDRPVICFTGDGGFWYHIGELETAVRYGIKTVTIVNNNAGFGQVKHPIDKLYADKKGDSEIMWQFKSINFAKIAEEIGCLGIRVEEPSEFADAFRTALSDGRPSVIDVVTDVSCKAPDTWG